MPKIDTQFTSDDQAVIAAYHRQQVELDKLKRKLQETNKAAGKGAGDQNKLLDGQKGKLKEVAESFVGVSAVVGALTSAYKEQQAVVAALAKQTIAYQATISKLSLPTGLSPDQVDAIAGRLNATPETAAAAIAAVQGQGPVAPQRLEQLAGLATDARRVGVDAETAGGLFGALHKLDPKATAAQLQDRFVVASQQGIGASEITKYADVSSLDGKGRFERGKLLKQLDASPGGYAQASAAFAGSNIGQVQLGQQDLEIAQANASRLEKIQSLKSDLYGKAFDAESQRGGLLREFAADTGYNVRKFISTATGVDQGTAAQQAYNRDAVARRQSGRDTRTPEELAALDKQIEAINRMEAAATALNRRPTYAGLQNAEGGQ